MEAKFAFVYQLQITQQKKKKKITFVSVSSYFTRHFIQTNTTKESKGGIFVSRP